MRPPVSEPTPRSYFEQLYAANIDPWGFESRWYEQRKYALTLAALPNARYRSAFEPGCANGVLSEALAVRCDRVLATDIIASTVERARSRLAAFDHVRVQVQSLPDGWPIDEPFDLIVLSEIAYYFDTATLQRILRLVNQSLEPGGTLVATHWRGATDYPLSGDQTHQIIGRSTTLQRRGRYEDPEFLLDVWTRL